MKKSIRLLLASILMVPVFTLSSCVVGITCISHIDKDGNGRCDNCNQVQVMNVESIVIKTMPTKTYFAINDSFDMAGGVVTVTYNDGTPTEDMPFDDVRLTVRAPGMDSAGVKMVAITYGGVTTFYTIEVGLARFTVSFELGYDGAEEVPDQMVTVGNYATAPEVSRSGYSIEGWYIDAELTQKFDFAMTAIAADITLYANWIQAFTVTYDVNYSGGTNLTASTTNGKADSTITPDERDGYIFAGWYTDADCMTTFNFDQILTADITIYAKWVSDSTTMYTVTFNYNYGETPISTTTEVEEGSSVATPTTPTRDSVTTKGHQAADFVFGGWYTDAACTTVYNFSSAVTQDMTLYAKWTGTYIFEAEHVSFMDPMTGQPMQGMGASGGSVGPNMVDSPAPGMEGLNASNGYYVTYLYSPGLGLYFNIESDRDVSDATLIFRISAENAPYAITSSPLGGETENGTILSQYGILLNDTPIDYETIEITDTTGHTGTGGRRPFSDFTIAVNLSLKKGSNTFAFITENTNGMGGTMAATAPVIDCIKVTTSAELTWSPIIDNEFGQ